VTGTGLRRLLYFSVILYLTLKWSNPFVSKKRNRKKEKKKDGWTGEQGRGFGQVGIREENGK